MVKLFEGLELLTKQVFEDWIQLFYFFLLDYFHSTFEMHFDIVSFVHYAKLPSTQLFLPLVVFLDILDLPQSSYVLGVNFFFH